MFWPAPEDSTCSNQIPEPPKHFAIRHSKDIMIYLHYEEAEDEVCAYPTRTPLTVTGAVVRQQAVRTMSCPHGVGVDYVDTMIRNHTDPC
ncbi:hypothetical protein RRG08_003966 [Elysia crispata]|uniref:Uncharacterized protein n=1 Tax=Elysia crispata TaxID=231223 RepID=A0AAE1DEB2_9GAST|nr:hypothetical protein RRG08_003966 [Elysia crispata]